VLGLGGTALGQVTSRAVSCWIRCLERRLTRDVGLWNCGIGM